MNNEKERLQAKLGKTGKSFIRYGIWIAYHPNLSDAAKEVLLSFAGRYVVVSSRGENEGDISLVAWGRVDTFNIEGDTVNEGRIKDFIKRYDNRGPENVRQVQF